MKIENKIQKLKWYLKSPPPHPTLSSQKYKNKWKREKEKQNH